MKRNIIIVLTASILFVFTFSGCTLGNAYQADWNEGALEESADSSEELEELEELLTALLKKDEPPLLEELTEEIVLNAFDALKDNVKISSTKVGKDDGKAYSSMTTSTCGQDSCVDWVVPDMFYLTYYKVDGKEYMDYSYFEPGEVMAKEKYGPIAADEDYSEYPSEDDSAGGTFANFGKVYEIIEIDGLTAKVFVEDESGEGPLRELYIEVDPKTQLITKISYNTELFIVESTIEYITEIYIPNEVLYSNEVISGEEAMAALLTAAYAEVYYGIINEASKANQP